MQASQSTGIENNGCVAESKWNFTLVHYLANNSAPALQIPA